MITGFANKFIWKEAKDFPHLHHKQNIIQISGAFKEFEDKNT